MADKTLVRCRWCSWQTSVFRAGKGLVAKQAYDDLAAHVATEHPKESCLREDLELTYADEEEFIRQEEREEWGR